MSNQLAMAPCKPLINGGGGTPQAKYNRNSHMVPRPMLRANQSLDKIQD